MNFTCRVLLKLLFVSSTRCQPFQQVDEKKTKCFLNQLIYKSLKPMSAHTDKMRQRTNFQMMIIRTQKLKTCSSKKNESIDFNCSHIFPLVRENSFRKLSKTSRKFSGTCVVLPRHTETTGVHVQREFKSTRNKKNITPKFKYKNANLDRKKSWTCVEIKLIQYKEGKNSITLQSRNNQSKTTRNVVEADKGLNSEQNYPTISNK